MGFDEVCKNGKRKVSNISIFILPKKIVLYIDNRKTSANITIKCIDIFSILYIVQSQNIATQ